MNYRNRFAAFMAGSGLAFMTATSVVSAEDIDLFQYSAGGAAPPNVLFLIDNSANWGSSIGDTTQEAMTRDALQEVLVDSDDFVDQIRVGLMPFSNSNNPRGSKVISRVRMLDQAYQDDILTRISQANEGNDGSLQGTNNAPYAMSMNEALLYFSGQAPHSGLKDGDHDALAVDGGAYVSPAAEGCGRNYVIVVGNGGPDKGEDNDAEAKLSALGGVMSDDPISINPSNNAANWADEFARYMAHNQVIPEEIRQGRQDIITYVIDVFNPDVNQNNPFLAERAWMRSIARWGNGRYFAAHSTEDIKVALTKIVEELLAVNNVFAASTLPVSVNVRGTNLNQVYMGVFRPDEENRTRWMGNLKLYQLASDTDNSLFLADANGDRAQSASTGFIVNDATSFWTSASSFWEYQPRGTPPSGSDMPDGEVVEKGGAGQRQREQYAAGVGTRDVFTCTGSCGAGSLLADTPFDTSNASITSASLGGHDPSVLIPWVRGDNNVVDEDPDDGVEDADTLSSSSVRPSIHGDVLHSRPAVINMGETEDDGVYVFYGSNDGMFRAIKGGRNATDGEELWAFIPEEFFGDLGALRDNDTGKRYFPDGSIGVLHDREGVDGATEDRVWIYLSMRRGGRFIYALDVTDPHNPKLLWRRSHEDAGFAELGQTWSMPTATRILLGEEEVPVVIFGAGYDADIEDAGVTSTSRTMGRGLYIVHAETGEVIWQVGPNPDTSAADYTVTVSGMQHSMAADPTVLDRNQDGLADRIYTADTGGNIWRFDIGVFHPYYWRVNHLAALGSDQKFLYRPDVVYAEENGEVYDAVLIGSGNREDPFDTSVVNHFYMIKDRATGRYGDGDTAYTRDDLYDATDNLVQEGTTAEQSTAQTSLQNADGWYVELENPGEKVVSGATTVNRTTFFNTNEPPDIDMADCESTLGVARNYMVDFANASATMGGDDATAEDRASQLVGGGYPPSPVPVVVEIDGKYYEAVISGTEVKVAPGPPLDKRFRVWWNKNPDA